jgi:opacity protein-like surface antigen
MLFKLLTVKKIFLLSFYISFICQFGFAQRGWEAGGGVGVSHYFGDLNTNFSVQYPGLALTAIGRFNFNDRICVKMAANYGSIRADDKNSSNIFERKRNLNFKSQLFDGTAQLEFNFMPYNYFDKNQRFSPYLFAGFNVFNFNPKAKLNNEVYNLRDLGTEGQFKGEEYYTTQMGLVYGGGLKIALNEAWSINLEISARRLFTDYLDDVSTVYPNMNDLRKLRGDMAVSLSDPSVSNSDGKKIGIPGRQRGEQGGNDIYTFTTISLLYYFGDLKCPTITRN